jgi:flagellar basal-body rod protein FlgG
MIRAYYTATAGAKTYQKHLDVIANNLSNIQTHGYKTLKGEFSDLLYTNVSRTGENLMVGSGSKLLKTDSIFAEGAFVETGIETDYAIVGDGFFSIQKGDEIFYTRNGAFTITEIDEELYLTLDGNFVLNSNGEPINLSVESSEVGEQYDLEKIPGVTIFTNNFDLERVGESLFAITNEDAEYMIAERPDLMVGYVEASNVELTKELTQMIQAQRAFQFNSRIIQVADEIEQTINNLKS